MKHTPPALQVVLSAALLIGAVATTDCARPSPAASEQRPNAANRKQIESPLPAPTGHVNDYAHALDDGMRAQLEQALVELRQRSQIEFAIAIVNTTGGQPIFDYSLAVARGWGVGGGERGDGIVLLIAVDDHQWRVQISRSLERDLPNEVVKQAGETMKAPFSEGHYGEGVRRCVESIIKTLAARRGFAPITIPAPLLHD